jgi:preprotein translocase subunit SecE
VPRPDVPGALEHASSDVDEFDAALARGAGGVAAPVPDAEARSVTLDDEPPVGEAPVGEHEEAAAADVLDEDRISGGRAGGDGGAPGGGGRGGGEGARERPSGAPLPSGNRAVAFIRASWAELQRVQWPDRRQVTQATAVVLGFVAVAGAYLGLADFVAKEIVEFVL